MASMYNVVCCSGERRVKVAVEVKRCIVASLMKWASSSSSPPPGFDGSEGWWRRGAGMSMANLLSASPSLGCEGMEPECVWTVREVFQPEMYWESSSRPILRASFDEGA